MTFLILRVFIALPHQRQGDLYTERQKSCTTFSFDFFWIEIDDYENQCSIVFMPVQRTIVVEKIKCV